MKIEGMNRTKKFLHSQGGIAALLVVLSLATYLLHFYLFSDLHGIFYYLVLDIAFLFLNVILVMMVLQRLLESREREAVKRKHNMMNGLFFAEAGTELIRKLAPFDPESGYMGAHLVVDKNWTDAEFTRVRREVQERTWILKRGRGDLKDIKDYLAGKRQFLLRILENPNLHEHESFTNMLWAVYHLSDELSHRRNPGRIPAADLKHILADMGRAYQELVLQWLEYMKHLKADYPYLFSFAMRTNPFDANAEVEVR